VGRARLDARALIERLVAFDTTSRNSNLALIEFVRDYLAGFGVHSDLIHDEAATKANLFATIGPEGTGGIVLSGHTDVVPVDGQTWSSDPFHLLERDGRLYGRGACDMKGFLALVLARVPEFVERRLTKPIHLAFSYDEEVGCLGVPRLLAEIARRNIRPECCIIGEPTEMRVVSAHKGKLTMRCCVKGRACHSAHTDAGVNAVEYAALLIAFLRGEARRRRVQGPFDERFDPPYSTVQTGVVGGGNAVNVVPADCAFEFEIRHLPTEQPEALIERLSAYAEGTLVPEMRAVAPESGIAFERQSSYPGLDMDESSEAVRLVQRLSGSNETDTVSFGTEGGLYRAAGIPAVVCGPGSIRQAHKADEYVALEQLALGGAFLDRLMATLSA
jgi:acetylornithine deacetylase